MIGHLLVNVALSIGAAAGEPTVLPARVQGHVLSLYGEALQGTRIEFVSGDRSFVAESNLRGEYDVAVVPPGTYKAVVQLSGFARWVEAVEIARGGTMRLDFGLAVLRIDDRVSTVRGTVRDGQAAPIAGATVAAHAVVNPRIAHRTLTDASGRFSLPIGDGGLYLLSAHRPGFEADARALVIPQRPDTDVQLVLRPLRID